MRFSATTLEQYRLYETESYVSYSDLIATLQRRVTVTRPMQVGMSFEDAVNSEQEMVPGETVTVDGITFDCEAVLAARNIVPLQSAQQPKVVREMCGHDISGRADYLHGTNVHDLKATSRPIEMAKYIDSLQWRVYLWAFNAKKFVYDVAYLAEKKGVYYARQVEVIEYYRYPGMELEIERWVRALSDFVEENTEEINDEKTSTTAV